MNMPIREMKEGVGTRIKEERNRLGISQAIFAEQCGISRATQCQYETDAKSTPYWYLMAANKLGADMYYVFFGKREECHDISLSMEMLMDIFEIVDEVGVDNKDNPLPLQTRQHFFAVLCSAYTTSASQKINMSTVHAIINKIRKERNDR